MRIRFGLGLDGAVWPDVLANKKAVLGEIAVGELGLLQILETHTGLRGIEARPFTRLLAYHSVLEKTLSPQRFYSASFRVDPLGVSRDLLNLRNELRMAGWDGSSIAEIPKLVDLAAVEAQAKQLREIPDRLRDIATALETRKSFPLSELAVTDLITELPMLWQKVIGLLSKVGVKVMAPASAPAPMAALQPNSNLRLLQCRDPWAAAQWLSAYLAQLPKDDLATTVIVAPNRNAEILANACRVRGIPFGAATGESSLCRPSVQIVLIGMLLAFGPQNPLAAKALLLQNESHIWPKLRRRLLGALDQAPALGSEDWNKAVEAVIKEYAEKPESKVTPDDVKERLAWAFGVGKADRKQGIALNDLIETLAPLIKWLQGYGQLKERPSYQEAGSLAREFVSSLRLLAKDEKQRFSEDELIKLFREVVGTGVDAQVEPARAGGPVVVSDPEKVLSPAQHIVWWDFTVGATSSGHQRFWLSKEITALEKAGVQFKGAIQQNAFKQEQWLRPVRLAQKSVMAVSFGVDAKGEAEFVHPVLDYLLPQDKKQRTEVLNKIIIDPGQNNAPDFDFKNACKVITENKTVTPWPYLQGPSADWTFPADSIEDREKNSPSSLLKLLGCPVAYALEYGVGLQGPWAAGLDEGALLGGKLAHAVFQRVFKKGAPPSVNEVDAVLEQTWNALLPVYAQALLLDENQMRTQQFAKMVLAAGKEYCRFLNENKLEVIGAEDTLTGALGASIPISGRLDQLLGKNGKPCLVIDFKFGGLADRKAELAQGDALQLCVYATIGSQGKAPLDIGYFIIADRQTLILGDDYKAALAVKGPSVADVMARMGTEIQNAYKALRAGACQAPGVSDELTKASKWDVPCIYCEYDGICGRRWADIKKSTWRPRS